MKNLLILRHAKSDWNAAYGEDHDRPLNRRGEQAADRVGRFLAAGEQVPDAIITSSAVRARTTVERAVAAGSWNRVPEVTEALYATHADAVLEVLHRVSDQHQSLLIAGHEPTWSDLASRLIGGGSLRVVTAALVQIEFQVERWSQLRYGGGTLRWMLPPKVLQKVMGS